MNVFQDAFGENLPRMNGRILITVEGGAIVSICTSGPEPAIVIIDLDNSTVQATCAEFQGTDEEIEMQLKDIMEEEDLEYQDGR